MKIVFILLLLCMTISVMAQAPAEKRSSILDVLKVNQKVSLKEISGRYLISLFDGLPDAQGYTVKAIEADYLVIEDIIAVNLIHIPVYSIKSIVRVKLVGK